MYVLQSNGYISEDSLISFEEILHLIERCLVCWTFCATCFFLPEVLYLVRYEMGLWIKEGIFTCWKKHYLIEMKRYIFKRSGFLHRNATYWKGILLLLKECHTLWMKVSVCKACSCQLELVLQEKHACVIVSCSHLQCFHCLFQVWGKDPQLIFFHVGWITT